MNHDQKLLHNFFQEQIAAWVFPGCNYTYFKNGESMSAGVGHYTYDPESTSVTADTIYDVASLTKLFTQIIFLKLFSDGIISPSDKIGTFLAINVHGVTIQDLLTHRSWYNKVPFKFNDQTTYEEFISGILSITQEFPVHQDALYSDVNYILLWLIAEKATWMSIHELYKKYIIDPLGLKNTSSKIVAAATAPTTDRDERTWQQLQWVVHDKKWRLLGVHAWHAGLFSTSSDMVQVCKILTKENAIGITEEWIDRYFKPIANDLAVCNGGCQLNNVAISGLWVIVLWVTSQTVTGQWETQKGSYLTAISPAFSGGAIILTGFTGGCLLVDPMSKNVFVFCTNRTYKCKNLQDIKTARNELYQLL